MAAGAPQGDFKLVLTGINPANQAEIAAELTDILQLDPKLANDVAQSVAQGSPIILLDGMSRAQAANVRTYLARLLKLGAQMSLTAEAVGQAKRIPWPAPPPVTRKPANVFVCPACGERFIVQRWQPAPVAQPAQPAPAPAPAPPQPAPAPAPAPPAPEPPADEEEIPEALALEAEPLDPDILEAEAAAIEAEAVEAEELPVAEVGVPEAEELPVAEALPVEPLPVEELPAEEPIPEPAPQPAPQPTPPAAQPAPQPAPEPAPPAAQPAPKPQPRPAAAKPTPAAKPGPKAPAGPRYDVSVARVPEARQRRLADVLVERQGMSPEDAEKTVKRTVVLVCKGASSAEADDWRKALLAIDLKPRIRKK